MYNDDNSCAEEYKLNGNQFWKLVGGYEDAGKDMLAMLSGLAVKVSIRDIVNNKVQELVREYRARPIPTSILTS